jgi:hypothetical protein
MWLCPPENKFKLEIKDINFIQWNIKIKKGGRTCDDYRFKAYFRVCCQVLAELREEGEIEADRDLFPGAGLSFRCYRDL